MGSYFTTKTIKILKSASLILLGLIIGVTAVIIWYHHSPKPKIVKQVDKHWFMLHRKSNVELLYKGVPGEVNKSQLVKVFRVKVGMPGQRPTPLPQLLGKKYWVITAKTDSSENPETAPYFLELNVPAPEEAPYGPSPYKECYGLDGEAEQQCNWELAGAFGLHGVNGDLTRLDSTNPGSSGCVRHTDSDITYLYQLLNPEKEEIRYYIKDI